MARRKSGVVRTPDSGYKFVCQACENEVVQVPLPELVFEIIRDKRGNQTSEGLQCCFECAEEIKEENAKLQGKKPPTSQVRPLRPMSELPPDLQAARAELERGVKSDEKIDKLCDAVASLSTMMMQFLSTQMPLQPQLPAPPPVVLVDAPSRTTKPKNKASKTQSAKPKSSRKRL